MRKLLLAAVALLGSLAPAQMTDLPPLSEPRIVTTVFEDGGWHKNPKPSDPDRADNTGDGTVLLVVDGDVRRWVLVMRMGTPPPGGCYWTKPYTDDDPTPYEGWTGNQQEPPIKGMPGGRPYSHVNIDTHHGFQHPDLHAIEWFSGVKPGNINQWAAAIGNPPHPAGLVFNIQRSTQHTLGAEPENFTRYLDETPWLTPHIDAPWEHPTYYAFNNSYWGGVAEGAVLIDTYNFPYPVGVGFYTSKKREEPDAFGNRHRGRIGRYAFFLEGPSAMQPVRNPAPGPESYVFDPVRDGASGLYGDTNESAIWGTGYGILQMSVWINPYDGLYHLVCWGRKPNTGQGKVNKFVGLFHAWSADQGLHWVPDARDGPVFTRESLGWPDIGEANQMNSPHVCVDPWLRKGYLFFWGNETGATNYTGTRLYCMEFAIP